MANLLPKDKDNFPDLDKAIAFLLDEADSTNKELGLKGEDLLDVEHVYCIF